MTFSLKRLVLERKCEESERNGGQEERRQDGGKGNRGSVGGKAKQVYVEKRRKQEEEWERKTEIWKQRRKQHKQEEARPLVGVEFLGQTHKPKGASKKLQKCIERDIGIPTLNEQ